TMTRANPMLLFPNTRSSPAGIISSSPSNFRTLISRRPTYSTVPASSPIRMRSPTPMVSSKRRNSPEMTSLTRVCAPNPMARPAMPAPASSGPTSSPSSARTMMPATPQTTYLATEPTRSATVRTRCRRLSVVGRSRTRRTHRFLSRPTMPRTSSARKTMNATRTAVAPTEYQKPVSRTVSVACSARAVTVSSAALRLSAICIVMAISDEAIGDGQATDRQSPIAHRALRLQHRQARERLALDVLEHGAAAGGDVADGLGQAGLVERGHRVAAADDREGAAGGGLGEGAGDGEGALGERGHLEHPHRAVPDHRRGVPDHLGVAGARGGADVHAHPTVGDLALDHPRRGVGGEAVGDDVVGGEEEPAAGALVEAPGLLQPVLLHERGAGLVAEGAEERVRHRPADEHGVGLLQQRLDDADLVRDLGAAEDGDERAVGVVERLLEE